MKNSPLLSAFSALVIFLASAAARAETAYLTALPDVPLMAQMQEIRDSDVVFDKAQGRIVEETVKASKLTPQQIVNFYQATLPALGWKTINPQRFSRNGEQLIVNLDKLKDEGLVKFSVSPIQP